MSVFLTSSGEPFSRDHMTSNVKARIDAAKLGKVHSTPKKNASRTIQLQISTLIIMEPLTLVTILEVSK